MCRGGALRRGCRGRGGGPLGGAAERRRPSHSPRGRAVASGGRVQERRVVRGCAAACTGRPRRSLRRAVPGRLVGAAGVAQLINVMHLATCTCSAASLRQLRLVSGPKGQNACVQLRPHCGRLHVPHTAKSPVYFMWSIPCNARQQELRHAANRAPLHHHAASLRASARWHSCSHAATHSLP